jgi:hypothetical protein
MAAVAERFIAGFSAPAEGEPVPDREGFTVSRYHRNTATNPEWPVLSLCRILDNNNGLLQCRLNGLAGLQIPDDKPPERPLQASSIAVSRASLLSEWSVRFQIPPACMQNRAWTQRFCYSSSSSSGPRIRIFPCQSCTRTGNRLPLQVPRLSDWSRHASIPKRAIRP